MFWKKPSLKSLLPPPVQANHAEYSMILSLHDDPARPTPSLIQLSLRAIELASRADLSELSTRFKEPPVYSEIWPGEHYKLLAGLTAALQPAVIIEIGTATGLSALAMKKYLPLSGKIATFDLAPWQSYSNSHFIPEDFADGRLVQHVANLAESSQMEKYAPLIQEADLIFIDATHDGELETKLLNQLEQIKFRKKVYIFFDDIRVWTMLKMWREISLPKIDLTSFGHWSGSGLVEL